MIIEFSDPGYDWTPIIVTSVIAGVVLVVALLFEMTFQLRGRRSGAGLVAQVLYFVFAVVTVFGVGICGAGTGSGVYNARVEAALYHELGEQGFEGISLTSIKGESARSINAVVDGKEFNGKIENLRYPKDYTYKIIEITE